MKELSIVKQMVSDGQISQEVAEKYFPELKESGDERIRTRLINYFSGFYDRFATDRNHTNVHWEGLEVKKVLAWLEKQGEQKSCKDEQKPAWSEEDSDMADDIVKSLKKYQLQMPNYRVELQMRWLKSLKNRVLPQPRQDWSEEDEKGLGDALWCCKQAASIAKDENDMGNAWYAENWLKSLKDRVQPKPNQEWSEEDEIRLKHILRLLDVKDDKKYLLTFGLNSLQELKQDIAWLKSLRPQNTWKPSDEQMADLWNMVCECRPADQQLLQDIYYGLKTLRGE